MSQQLAQKDSREERAHLGAFVDREQRDRLFELAARRGYGGFHRVLRKQLAPVVAAGLAVCARCGERIEPGESSTPLT